MKPHVLFNITLHGHQPIGNLPDVMGACFESCYRPFLELFSRHPRIRFSYHLSGCLLEWLEEHRREHLDLLADMVARGQVEIIGGAFYEPIVTAIPRADAQAQIRLGQEYVRSRFGTRARGIWLPERVWEPSLPSLLKRSGVEFTLLDDTHFRSAGLTSDELHGYFLAEDQGELLAVFPMLESLRYTIPFADPAATIAILRAIAEGAPGTMVAYGDDVEKFGVWPDTFKLCYEEGWLARFLDSLEENLPWIDLVSLGEAIDERPPRGIVYPPETSYAEMNEWTLPAHLAAAYGAVRTQVRDTEALAPALPFVRGPSWRSFRVKYPEIRRLYGRMIDISRRMAPLPDEPAAHEARRELYRGQCNCPYWHGIFGGHYLPHLREAVWSHLLAAERLADRLSPLGPRDGRAVLERADIDIDGHEELFLRNESLGLLLSPFGGRAIEFDLRLWGLNLFSVLARRREAYHDDVKAAAHGDGKAAKSIHHIKRSKDPDLEEALRYDPYEHLGFADLVLAERPTAAGFLSGAYRDEGGLHARRWAVDVEEGRSGPRVAMRSPRNGAGPLAIAKTFLLEGPSLRVDYAVENVTGMPWKGFLSVEIPFALQTGRSPNRVWRERGGRVLGPLGVPLADVADGVSVCDWDHDLAIDIAAPGARVVSYAVKTVSQSESGFEGVFQHAVAALVYELELAAGGSAAWTIALEAARAPVRAEVDLAVR